MKRILQSSFLLIAFSLAAHAATAVTAPPILPWPSMTNHPVDAATFGSKAIPAAPSNLQAISVSTNQVTLAWTLNSSDATEVHVEGAVGGGSFAEIGTVSGDSTGAIITNLLSGTTYMFRVRASNTDGFSGYSNTISVTTEAGPTCTGTSTELCLFGGRFKIDATWKIPDGTTGNATVVQLTDDSGYLWFFSPTDPEVIVKIINGCPVNNQFWFFAGGLTNVQVVIHVTDTHGTAVKTYTNKLNTVFAPIQDTSAIPCP